VAQTSTVPVQARDAMIDSLRLVQRKAESAEWYAERPDLDGVSIRSLAQTAIYALQDVIQALDAEEGRELRRPTDVTERIEADL
jgi:hypothetical protein